jgi:hypothetical protein
VIYTGGRSKSKMTGGHLPDPLRHQITVVVLVPGPPVEPLGVGLAAFDFQMEGADAQLAAGFFQYDERPGSQAAAPVVGSDVQLVQDGVPSSEFEAEAQGQDEVAHDLFPSLENPEPAEAGISEKTVQ